jgi:hypothetical protein
MGDDANGYTDIFETHETKNNIMGLARVVLLTAKKQPVTLYGQCTY